jgi:hypothetical protein
MASQAEKMLASIGKAAEKNDNLRSALEESFAGDILTRLESSAEASDEPEGPGGAVTREQLKQMTAKEKMKHFAAGGYVEGEPGDFNQVEDTDTIFD